MREHYEAHDDGRVVPVSHIPLDRLVTFARGEFYITPGMEATVTKEEIIERCKLELEIRALGLGEVD